MFIMKWNREKLVRERNFVFYFRIIGLILIKFSIEYFYGKININCKKERIFF